MRLSLIILTCLSICSPGAFFVVAQNADEAAIKELFVMFTKSWDEPGMPGFEDLFTDDADFVVITGRRLKGRTDIATYHRALLRTRYQGSRSLPMEAESVRFLASDIAVAHVTSGARYLQDGRRGHSHGTCHGDSRQKERHMAHHRLPQHAHRRSRSTVAEAA